MGGRPHRELPDRRAWPRSPLDRRDGLRRRQPDHRPEGRHHRQFRRLHVAVLLLGADLSLRDAAVGPVCDPGDPRQCPRRLHQHVAGRRLSRRGAAGGDLSRRAHHGDGGARARRVAGRAPAQELRQPVPAPDAGDHELRRRRLPGLARRRHEGVRLPGLRQAQGGCGEARQAARHRHELLHRGLRHRALGRGRLARRRRRPLGVGGGARQRGRHDRGA